MLPLAIDWMIRINAGVPKQAGMILNSFYM